MLPPVVQVNVLRRPQEGAAQPLRMFQARESFAARLAALRPGTAREAAAASAAEPVRRSVARMQSGTAQRNAPPGSIAAW